jgi:diguanylate cyclase (GGDEF)-like protein
VLLPGVELSQGVEVASRLRAAIERSRPGELELTISLGVAAAAGSEVDGEALVRAADEALLRAKQEGRNRVVASGEDAGEPDGDRRRIEPDAGARPLPEPAP